MLWTVVKIAAAVLVIVIGYVWGAGLVRSFGGAAPSSKPPEPGELAAVDIEFQCQVCGTLVTMTAAPEDEIPEAPRHCREDMLLMSDIGLDSGAGAGLD